MEGNTPNTIMSLPQIRQKVDKLLGEYNTARATIRAEKKNLREAKQTLLDIKEAQRITQAVAETLQRQAHSKISNVVTACLKMVFSDKDYEFELKFERKRNRTEAKPILVKDGNEIQNPLDEDSGGVVDVAGFALQLSAIMLTKPKVRNFMGLDEPFKYVSEEYRDNVRQMIEKLSKDFGIQFLIVTHMRELETGKVVRL
jgi:DNA repair exonuclease SbcCD ATPase subunit